MSPEQATEWFATYDPDGECKKATDEVLRLRVELAEAQRAEELALRRANVRFRVSGDPTTARLLNL